MMTWISVEQHTPTLDKEILMFTPNFHSETSCGKKFQVGYMRSGVTHWMPLVDIQFDCYYDPQFASKSKHAEESWM